jgi:hypothetical protein
VTATLLIENGTEARTTEESPVARLRRAFPWPDARPELKGAIQAPGWFGEGTDEIVAGSLTSETRLVVELGAWLGMSTRFIADLAPNATVISIDHWQGSPEHRANDDYRPLLSTLYDTFLALCWRYRDQIVPLRMSTLEGLRTLAEYGLAPDVVFIDAEHSFDAVSAELEMARRLFPRALLIGDDYDWQGVQTAVDRFARSNGLLVERKGARGWRLLERPHASSNGVAASAPGRAGQIVLVPHLNGIESACEHGLKELEMAGVRVVRRVGSSQIDLARSEMVSDALHEGYESILFIDADIGFEAADALRLLDRQEPVVSGVYAKKGPREVASAFAEGVKQIVFGPEAPALYPLKYAATGFLRIRAEVLRAIIEKLKMPLCNTRWGRGFWPFFQSVIVCNGENDFHYLGEDWSFSHRLAQIGVTPLADTSFRLYHIGSFGYSWEEAGSERQRFRTYTLSIG